MTQFFLCSFFCIVIHMYSDSHEIKSLWSLIINLPADLFMQIDLLWTRQRGNDLRKDTSIM